MGVPERMMAMNRLRLGLAALARGISASAPASLLAANSARGPAPVGGALPGEAGVWRLGGFARLDVIHDLSLVDDPRQFDPAKVLVPRVPTNATLFQVSASRLNLDVSLPKVVDRGRVFFEIDFFASSGAPRIGHAYADAWRFRVGQDWSTVSLEAERPPVRDMESLIAVVVQRSPLVRYTQPLGHEWSLVVAAEYLPATAAAAVSSQVPGRVETTIPDGVARLHFRRQSAEFAVHGLARWLRYDPQAGAPLSTTGGGVNVGVRVAPLHRVTVFGEGVAGAGIASYRGGPDLDMSSDGRVDATASAGETMGVIFDWLALGRLRSTALISVVRRLHTFQVVPTVVNRQLTYTAVNLVSRPPSTPVNLCRIPVGMAPAFRRCRRRRPSHSMQDAGFLAVTGPARPARAVMPGIPARPAEFVHLPV